MQKISLTGGGTLGPVTPLFAIVEVWRALHEDVEFVWVGTTSGPERKLVEQMYDIPFHAIQAARLPRYFSREWFFFPFRFCMAFFQSVQLLHQEKPSAIIGAGGYTQVPLMMAGWLFRIPCFVLQPDVDPLLSNRLVAGFVQRIFVAWEKTTSAFPAHKTIVTGNPVRPSLLNGSKEQAIKFFNLDPEKQTLLVFGGGTGARWLNTQIEMIVGSLLEKMNVIHVTGVGKVSGKEVAAGSLDRSDDRFSLRDDGRLGTYVVKEILEEDMKDAYAVTDVVVGRAGMGTITEIIALHKSAILIPLHAAQQRNADALNGAALVLDQATTTTKDLCSHIQLLMQDADRQRLLTQQIATIFPTGNAQVLIDEIKKTLRA